MKATPIIQAAGGWKCEYEVTRRRPLISTVPIDPPPLYSVHCPARFDISRYCLDRCALGSA